MQTATLSLILLTASCAAARPPDDELEQMTIDALSTGPTFTLRAGERISFDQEIMPGRTVTCHVLEWRGYGKMLGFLRQSDRVFFLEAEGRPAIRAEMDVGGLCNDDGSVRFAFLQLEDGARLEPGVRYALRPRNRSEGHRWAVSPGVGLTL